MAINGIQTARPKPHEYEIAMRKLRLIMELGEDSITEDEKKACLQVAAYHEQEVRRIRRI